MPFAAALRLPTLPLARSRRAAPRLTPRAAFNLFGAETDGVAKKRRGRYDAFKVDHTATTTPPSRSPRRADASSAPDDASAPLLSRYSDSGAWSDGDSDVTVFNWSDARARLALVNDALRSFVDESVAECAVNFDGRACSAAVARVMVVLTNATEADAEIVTSKLILAGGFDAADAVDAWCWAHPEQTHARAMHRVALTTRAALLDREGGADGAAAGAAANNAVAFYARDIQQECPAVWGAGEHCAATVDAALETLELADANKAAEALDALLSAGGSAAAEAAAAWCAARPDARHAETFARIARRAIEDERRAKTAR